MEAPATLQRRPGAAEVMSEIALRWEGKRGSGKYAMRQLSPVLRVVGVENVRRQVLARATLTQRCGYTEEDVSKIALWGEGRGRLDKRPGVQLEHAQGDGWLC